MPRWRWPTILLHWGLSVTVTIQLGLSLLMWVPDEGPEHTSLKAFCSNFMSGAV